ncbi:hypothetical protein [Halobacterium litoreum]|uniref:CARDB protein n=1 Tax=Halobacterium litoreum TaxID=2039234 RepID=A0ABD5NBJ3_9EURY|nr:hypothetical protein [Halobacterium litoreum]UHH14614.1 hypothetical protein LT972_06335 [Halobacterium litoreum]
MYRVAAVVTLLVASLVAGPVVAGASNAGPPADARIAASDVASQQSATIQKSIHLSLTPGEPGEIGVAVTYSIPDPVTSLSVNLPDDARTVQSDDFQSGDGAWSWDGDGDSATLRLSLPANKTTTGSRSHAGVAQEGDYSFVDAGSWALVTVPTLRTEWGWRGDDVDVDIAEDVSVDGEGSTGGEIAYLGPVETHTRTANGQTFTLAVPERAEMAESPARVLDALSAASERLRVGSRDSEVWFGVAPTDVSWGIRGVEYGGTDSWVVADARLDDPGNVWFHEYVHTRQDYTPTSSGRWTVEASAEYYAAYMSLREGYVEFDAFQRYLSYGEREPWNDAVLADPGSWPVGANYIKGSLVWGSIDRRLRLATDSSFTMNDVFYQLNRQQGRVSNDDLLRAVASASSTSVGQYAQRYTATSDTPDMWSRFEHADAFDTRPPRMDYDVAGYEVTGPFRDATFEEPPTLYVGETLTVGATVTNDGGTTGEYVATLSLAGDTMTESTAELVPGETDAITLQHQFTDPGTYNVTVGRNQVPVVVREPATPTVESLSASPDPVEGGETVTVTATLSNPTDGPATGPVALTLDGRQVATFEATLDPGESVTRTVTLTAPDTGVLDLAAGDQSARVSVAGSGGSVPGFGVAPAVAGVALAVALAALRRR